MSLTNVSEAKAPLMNGSGSHSVAAVNGHGKPLAYTSTYKSIVTTPKTMTATTPTVKITGTLNNFWSNSKCSVGFSAVYVLRAD